MCEALWVCRSAFVTIFICDRFIILRQKISRSEAAQQDIYKVTEKYEKNKKEQSTVKSKVHQRKGTKNIYIKCQKQSMLISETANLNKKAK